MVPERTSSSSSRTPPQSEYAKTSTSKNESDKLVVMDDTQGDTSEATDDGGILDCRQNFAAEVETAINAQINRELDASYRYFAMANYFLRPSVALEGSASFFAEQSLEERSHAQKLINYQNSRGGKVVLLPLKAPPRQQWATLHEAMSDAFELERQNNDALLKLHYLASEKNDPHLTNFLEEFYLKEQVVEIAKMARFANQLKRVGHGLGEHIWDQELLQKQRSSEKRKSI